MKIYFSIPDFYYHFDINSALLRLMDERPEIVNPGVVIDSVYGSFPNAVWNGGRVCLGMNDSKNVEDTLAYFNNRGVSVRYTFTNHLIEEKHTHDLWCNLLLDKADNGKNAIILNSDILNQYIKDTHPGFERISSTTKCLETIEEFNKECERDFSLCVLHYDLNNDFDALKLIKRPEKTEILVNESCEEHCKLRQMHYTALARWQMEYKPTGFTSCKYHNYAATLKRKHYISYQDIVEKYLPMGFTHFKLSGRTTPKYDVVEGYVQYFIRPEFQTEIRLSLLASTNCSSMANTSR